MMEIHGYLSHLIKCKYNYTASNGCSDCHHRRIGASQRASQPASQSDVIARHIELNASDEWVRVVSQHKTIQLHSAHRQFCVQLISTKRSWNENEIFPRRNSKTFQINWRRLSHIGVRTAISWRCRSHWESTMRPTQHVCFLFCFLIYDRHLSGDVVRRWFARSVQLLISWVYDRKLCWTERSEHAFCDEHLAERRKNPSPICGATSTPTTTTI